MANQNINIAVGNDKSATIKVLDAQSNDITANGVITVTSSAPTVVSAAVGVQGSFLLTALKVGTAQITTSYTNSAGTISEVDTVNPPDPPESISVTYSA